MGDFNINVRAVGGHGCQRDKKSGELVTAHCGQKNCPDCLARKFVSDLQAAGCSVNEALLIHWPSGTGTVLDNLLTKQRSGNF